MPDVIYRHAPLVEAVCELRFLASEAWDSTIPGLVFANLQSRLPKKSMTRRVRMGATTEDGPRIDVTELVRFSNESGNEFVRLGPNFLSIHRTAPYPGWSGFRPLISAAISAYSSVTPPAGVQRVGLRYVNRIEFQEAEIAFADHFRFYPHVEAPLPELTIGAKAEAHFPFEGDRDLLKLRLFTTPSKKPPTEGPAVIMLDLDYATRESQVVAADEISNWLEVAHGHVHTTFRACLGPSLDARLEPTTVN